jgi:DNA processing protein
MQIYNLLIKFNNFILMNLIYKIAVTRIRGVGHVIAKALIEHFGSAEAVFKAKKKQLTCIPGIGEKVANMILYTDALQVAAEELKFIEKHNIEVLFYQDDNYPKRLKNCYDAPILLYYKGTADLNHQRIVSVVGTRNATEYGRQLCKQLTEILKPHDVLVVSGLAYGIDVTAHKECLTHQIPTVGVLGHGLDRIYPKMHQGVAQKMVLNGGLLTEFPLYTMPEKENFPKRNRIIAGIADVVVVVEASIKGGALITAEIANSYNRDVYAFPGRTNDAYSEGCNFIIKTNRAGLINHPKDLIYYLGWDDTIKKPVQKLQAGLLLDLNPDEQKIVTVLQVHELAVDELAIRSGLPQSKLAMVLLTLEMRGIIVSLPGKMYRLFLNNLNHIRFHIR